MGLPDFINKIKVESCLVKFKQEVLGINGRIINYLQAT